METGRDRVRHEYVARRAHGSRREKALRAEYNVRHVVAARRDEEPYACQNPYTRIEYRASRYRDSGGEAKYGQAAV